MTVSNVSREQLRADVDAYLASGGTITVCPPRYIVVGALAKVFRGRPVDYVPWNSETKKRRGFPAELYENQTFLGNGNFIRPMASAGYDIDESALPGESWGAGYAN